MSSAPASALLSIVAAPALPAETAAPATPLDPTLTSAFSRMLEAEASLVQTVASIPTPLVTAEAAAPESAPQLVADQNTDAANDVALAMSQAAQASLSATPVAVEAPDFTEVPTTDVETNEELEAQAENTEESTASRSSSPFVEVAAPSVKSKPAANDATVKSIRTEAMMPDTETEIEPSTPTLDVESTHVFKAVTRTTLAPSNAMDQAPLELEASDEVESNFVTVQSTDAQEAKSAPKVSVASTQKSEDPEFESVQHTPALQQVHSFNDVQRASAEPARAPAAAAPSRAVAHVEATPAQALNVSRISEYEENDVELVVSAPEATTESAAIPLEFFLGAAGILNASAPREISSGSVETEVSDDAQPSAEDAVDADFSFSASTRFTRTTTSITDTTTSRADFAVDADVDDTTPQLPAAQRQIASDAEAEQAPAFIADLGEVRVIASQNTSRKDVQSVAAEDTKQKEIEFQPLRTELRAVAVDKKSGETVAEPAMKSAEFARVLSGWNGEKIARQSSPEGFSTVAEQRENSASTVTAPFVDGGRPETIASRNSSEPSATKNSSRAERLLDHTLDAIPNPLRVTTFEIKPEGHGAIRVRISARGEGEKAVWRVQIQTSDPAARSLLSEHLNELRERLPAENVQVELRGANDVRPEVSQRENGGSRERNGEQRQSRGEEQQRQPKQQKSGTFLEWLAAQE